eukprot:UC1_evm2s1029
MATEAEPMEGVENVTAETATVDATEGLGVPADIKEAAETQDTLARNAQEELRKLGTRAYFDRTVVPLLLEGLAELSKERPANPVEWLAAYLLQHKDDDLAGAAKPADSA